MLRFALSELHRAAPEPVGVIALRKGAPFGAVEIDAGGCTLCLSCVSACPTSALRDDPNAQCCALSKMPACSADCARQPAPSTSSR